MAPEHHDEDATLDRLLRSSARTESEDFVRPNNETITAYLTGAASEAERSEMLQALAQSGRFRREVMELAADLAQLDNADLSSRDAGNGEVPVYPFGTSGQGSVSTWLRSLFLRPAFAYGVLLVVLAVALPLTLFSPRNIDLGGSSVGLSLDLASPSTLRDHGSRVKNWSKDDSFDFLELQLRVPSSVPANGLFLIRVNRAERVVLERRVRASERMLELVLRITELKSAVYVVEVEQMLETGEGEPWRGEAAFFVRR